MLASTSYTLRFLSSKAALDARGTAINFGD